MDWTSRVRAAFASAAHVPDPDVIEELAQHARAVFEAARADGCPPDEADRRVTELLEGWRRDAPALHHTSRRAPIVEPPPATTASPWVGLTQDISYASRMLRRQPRYALIAIVTMGLGIGLSTALFSVTYGVLMRPLPWPDGDRLVLLKETRGGHPARFGAFTNAAYLAWREEASTIEEIAAWSVRVVTLGGVGDPERIRITTASPNLFPALRARPLLGSLFEARDESSPVVVLSERLWRERFGADPTALGRIVLLDAEPHTIVGVLPDRLAFPDRQSLAWVPFRVRPAEGNYLSMFSALARLRPGATPAQAAAEGTARGRFAPDTGLTSMAVFGAAGPIEIAAAPLREALTADVRRPLIVLLGAVGLLLLTATANVASLQLARATTRRREMAIRAAIGAGSARVTRQLLVESLMLGLTGGAFGLGLAWLLHRLLPTLLPADFPRADDLGLSLAVFAFALVLSVLTSMTFGVLPALRARRLNLVESLSEGIAPVGAGRGSRTAQARMAIMAGQVAIACVLLIGASLLGQSFVGLLEADRGYDPSGVVTARLSLPATMYSPERRYTLLEGILERLESMPGVSAAAFTSEMPITPGGSSSAFTMRSPRDGSNVRVQASPRIVSPRSFAALGFRVSAGRGFSDTDTESAPPVMVVNRTFARQYLGDDPLSAKLPMAGNSGENAEGAVIGVVDDVRYPMSGSSTQPEMFFSYLQMDGKLAAPVVTLLLRSESPPGGLSPRRSAAALRLAVREADPNLVAESVVPMQDRILTSLARPRLYAYLLGGFAVFAVVVAAVGLFGVLSYTVAQRSREIAVRTALGARPGDIAGLVLRQAMVMTVAGLAIGLLGSLALMRSVSSLLFGVRAFDGATYLVVTVALIVVAALASFAPAHRASTVSPSQLLR